MAKCDQGYLCRVCGEEVEGLIDSDLYLRYVIGWVDPETLHQSHECHLRCNPTLAQFINDPRFDPPVVVEGAFDRRQLDPEFVQQRETLITAGFARLVEISQMRPTPAVVDYPLPSAQAKWLG